MTRECWIDDRNNQWPVLPTGKLQFTNDTARALRAYLHRRDHFTCQGCGAHIKNPPFDYDGSYTFTWQREIQLTDYAAAIYKLNGFTHLLARLVVDHVIPWKDGGSNHPDNLQILCTGCNNKKQGVDQRQRERVLGGCSVR